MRTIWRRHNAWKSSNDRPAERHHRRIGAGLAGRRPENFYFSIGSGQNVVPRVAFPAALGIQGGHTVDTAEIDLAGLDIGDSIHISAVTLPKTIKSTITDRDFTIATMQGSRAVLTDEEEVDIDEIEEAEAAEDDHDDLNPEDQYDEEGELIEGEKADGEDTDVNERLTYFYNKRRGR